MVSNGIKCVIKVEQGILCESEAFGPFRCVTSCIAKFGQLLLNFFGFSSLALLNSAALLNTPGKYFRMVGRERQREQGL